MRFYAEGDAVAPMSGYVGHRAMLAAIVPHGHTTFFILACLLFVYTQIRIVADVPLLQ